MPGIKFPVLVEQFIAALERSGALVLLVGGMPTERPARISITSAEGTADCLLFIWTITPGGGRAGVRPANERRIQVTGARQFPLQPGRHTIISGYSEEFDAYAFWDAARHTKFSPRSPSMQISANVLEAASANGIAVQVKPAAQGKEVVVAAEPASLPWYIYHGRKLHEADSDAQSVSEMLSQDAENEKSFIDTARTAAELARRIEMVEVMRTYRDARFRPNVLHAYSYRCAICQCALKLVDAAHIVPVSHPKSTDELENGIALCRLHHGAYDNALLGIHADYSISLNPRAIRQLDSAKLLQGLETFRTALPRAITPPASLEGRPKPEFLKLGLLARQWPADMIY